MINYESRPWLQHYPDFIPHNIDTHQYVCLVDMIAETFEKYRHQDAFSCMDKSLSFNDLDIKSRNFAAYLHSIGMAPGDRIALMMPNLLQYPIALFGALRAGLIVVNTNPLYTPREMKHQFIDSGATAIVICENFAASFQTIQAETNIKHVILASIGEMQSIPKRWIVNYVVRNVKKMVPVYNRNNTTWFTDTLSIGAKHDIKPWKGKHDDTILLQYTGGTTGVSKGAMLTNENLIANMLQIRAVMEPYFSDVEHRVALSPLPLYHIFAFSVNCLALMGVGFKNVLVTNPRDLPSVIAEFGKHKINLMTGINTLFNALINHPDFAKQDFSHLRVTSGGGMAVQKAVAEKWLQITGRELAEGYGMTESSPVITTNPVVNGRIGTIGIPVPSTDVRIVDDNGIPIAVGEIGEIQARGPQIMKGYYNQPEATAAIIKDAWLGTGDMGLMSEDGYFRIVDRKKDMILVSGFNVYPNEIEDVIAMHPKVLEVAAIGVKDEKAGEVPKVFIVVKDATLTKEEIIAFCRTNLTAYKIPRYVEFKTELPKSNVGKILRKELRGA